MTKTKLYPYINAKTGDLQTLTRMEGAKLGKDWNRGKLARNEKNEKVFRFQIATQLKDKNGKMQSGVATVDIQEVKSEVIEDGNPGSE